MRIARILAENLTTEEQELLLWLSLNELPFESDGVSNLRALRLVERKLGSSNTACVTPFGSNVIAALQEMKAVSSDQDYEVPHPGSEFLAGQARI